MLSKALQYTWCKDVIAQHQRGVHDLVEYIMDEELHWETALMCDWEFARRVRTTITTMEYKQQVKETPCICRGYFSILANQNKILHKKIMFLFLDFKFA